MADNSQQRRSAAILERAVASRSVASAGSQGVRAGTSRATSIADSLTSREWEQLVDVVVRRLERRVTDQLSRQGRRFVPKVF